jgi:hypothetical protein
MKHVTIILLLALLAGCNPVNMPLNESQKKVILDEGQKVTKAFFDAMAAYDADKLFNLTDTASHECMIVTGNQIYNMVTEEQAIRDMIKDMQSQTFQTKDEKYVVINPNSFIYYWRGKNNLYTKSGDSIIFDNYLVSYVFRKVNGEWKFLYGHESYEMPAADTAATM